MCGRERAAGAYGTLAYFTAVVLFDFVPMRVAPTCFFGIVSYPMIGLRPSFWHAINFVAILILTNMTGAAMNMAIGTHCLYGDVGAAHALPVAGPQESPRLSELFVWKRCQERWWLPRLLQTRWAV